MSARLTRAAIVASLGAYATLFAAATARYPGGTYFDRTRPGYDFWRNFLCDLLWREAHNGAPNPAAPVARASFVAMTIAVVAFFWRLGWLLAPEGERRAAALLRLACVPVIVGMIGIAAASTGAAYQRVHGILTLVGGGSGIVAAAVGAWSVGRAARRARAAGRRAQALERVAIAGALAVAGSTVNMVLYVIVTQHLTGELVALPVAQKGALALLITWMLVTAYADRASAG